MTNNEREVVITGVSKRQVKLLDKMWSLDSCDEYLQWKGTLSEDDQREVNLLEDMLLLADIDEMAEEDVTDASLVLQQYRLQ